jgi:hypothetical protein
MVSDISPFSVDATGIYEAGTNGPAFNNEMRSVTAASRKNAAFPLVAAQSEPIVGHNDEHSNSHFGANVVTANAPDERFADVRERSVAWLLH